MEIEVRLKGDRFWEDLEIVKSCAGRKYNPEKKTWIIPVTDENLERLNQIEYLKPKIDEIKTRQELNLKKLNEEAEMLKQNYPFLFDYQAIAANLAIKNRFFLIADEMGLGKTVEVMPYIDRALKENKRVIILAPSSLLRQWNSELKRFLGITGEVIQGKQKKIRIMTYKTAKVILTTYESFWRDVKKIPVEILEKSVIIADEASKFKNKKTKIWKVLREIRDLVDGFIALTGTPVENSLVNFFNIIQIIKPFNPILV